MKPKQRAYAWFHFEFSGEGRSLSHLCYISGTNKTYVPVIFIIPREQLLECSFFKCNSYCKRIKKPYSTQDATFCHSGAS